MIQNDVLGSLAVILNTPICGFSHKCMHLSCTLWQWHMDRIASYTGVLLASVQTRCKKKKLQKNTQDNAKKTLTSPTRGVLPSDSVTHAFLAVPLSQEPYERFPCSLLVAIAGSLNRNTTIFMPIVYRKVTAISVLLHHFQGSRLFGYKQKSIGFIRSEVHTLN